jgi:DamX protein
MNRSTLMTEYQDISQRLEYLVAHSSQMVFVTGEDMAIQKGFVEAFLGQQSQHANVAFLAAKKGKKKDYYRQQLAEQLYFESGSPRQSLVQSFASRGDKDTPVLIAVTNAEHMAKDMLRELWDLVLQNRFARTNEQVNILVFGEQGWAEEVKAWLPTNNNDKPVLLTTQTLEYEEEHEIEGDLDEMINNRRKLFQERMKARSLNYESETPVLQAWWFRLMTACFFVVSFSAILIWQYFDVTSTAAREFANFLLQTEITETPADNHGAEEELTADTNDASTVDEITPLQNTELNTNPRISTPIKSLPQEKTVPNENARVSDSFAAALSSLDGPRPPVSEKQAQQGDVVTRSRPSRDLAVQEFVADISTEQLKALRARTVPETPDELANQTLDTVQDSFSELSQPLLNEASAMQAEQQQIAAQNNAGVASQNDTRNTDPALDAAIDAAMQVMAQLQNNGSEDSAAQQSQLPESQTTPVVVEALPQESEPVELPVDTNTQGSATDVNEETLLTGGEVEDYPVADIVNEAQVLAQNSQRQEESAQSDADNNVSEPDLPTTSAVTETVASADSAQDENPLPNHVYNEDVLLAQPATNYVLQISGVSSADLLIDYLTDNNLAQRVWVYHTQRYGGDWFVVLYNQSYATLDEARRSVAQVTDLLPTAQPFVKSIGQVQQEINALSQ